MVHTFYQTMFFQSGVYIYFYSLKCDVYFLFIYVFTSVRGDKLERDNLFYLLFTFLIMDTVNKQLLLLLECLIILQHSVTRSSCLIVSPRLATCECLSLHAAQKRLSPVKLAMPEIVSLAIH